VFTVDVSSDGAIVSGSGDESVRFWRAEPLGFAGDANGRDAAAVEKLKTFIAGNLPFMDFGSTRLTLSEQSRCDFFGTCANK
jgi:hypothetical protein